MNRAVGRALLLTLGLGLAGCDDVILFDVDRAGRLVVTTDAAGRTAAVGDATRPRHVCRVDPEQGTVERLTDHPRAVSWLRACGEGVLFVEGRQRLVLLTADAERVVYSSPQRLFGPAVHPGGELVAVLEAERLGVPGTLRLLELPTGREVAAVPQALLGAVWSPQGTLLVPRSTGARSGPLASGPGELVELRGAKRRRLASLPLPGAVLMTTDGDLTVCALPRAPGADDVALAVFRAGAAEFGAPARGSDFWPQLEPGGSGRVLFTRAPPEQASLEGELRLTRAPALADSHLVPTPGPVAAPRWVRPGRVAFLTADDHLVVQDLSGEHRSDFSAKLAQAFAQDSR